MSDFESVPSSEAPGAVYRIGTAGWSYEDWEGIFYPSPRPRGFRPLPYYCRFFNLVEINATFYGVMPPSRAEKWVRDVAGRPDFTFSLKLHRGLTHERPETLPAGDVAAIRDMCQVLADAGRLGALLIQFPWSFRFSEENVAYLARLLDAFQPFPCAVEVRHAGWHNERYLELLQERGAAFCNIDQPQLHDCLSPTAIATAPFSYLRLHGRNRANWFSEKADAAERYDHYYGPREVDEMARLAEALAEQTSCVMVTTNNHYRGQAAADALLLRAALEGHADAVPPPLLRAFPDLAAVPTSRAAEPDPGSQTDLFEQ
ncbi:MAG TPA: DUF72 domain-containing protein [Sumerlaeia bacterium]|nr:DUF72 domain-containing protein [Sumerlaeia bacterium]